MCKFRFYRHILLGSKGIDLTKISQKLEALNTRKTFEPLDPIADTDVQKYLKNERENAILSIIEEVHKNVSKEFISCLLAILRTNATRDLSNILASLSNIYLQSLYFDIFHVFFSKKNLIQFFQSYQSAQKQKWEHIKNEWRQEKIKLLNALVGPSQNWIDIQKAPEQMVMDDTSSCPNGRSTLNRVEMAYAREIYNYNNMILKGASRPNLVQKFGIISEEFGDSKITEIWDIMKYMVNVTPLSRSKDPIKSRSEMTQFIEQAKKYLENRYKVYMQTVISGNLREAQRGGIPSTFNLVSSFVGLTFNQGTCFGLQDAKIEGKPLWPMVYYCLRCGDILSALGCMKMAG